MCGIAGYVGDRESADVLVDALSKLEYRGYDSAGIAVFDHGNIKVKKCKGRLANLVEKMDEEGKPQGHVGIGHTRWATHGEPSDINSHPHGNKRVTIVHNGIIENYKKLKDFLIGEGYSFASETDTEVAAKLLDYYYDGDPMKTIAKVLSEIKGSYALGIMFRDFTDEIFAVATKEGEIKRSYFAGLATLPYLGWALGTFIGAILGNILPDRLMSALSVAIYGMFVAVVVPEMKKARSVLIVVIIAIILSCLFYYIPLLSKISSGITITIVAITAAIIGSIFFPVSDEADNSNN